VPVVVVPLFADQRANGHKIAASKTGVALDVDGPSFGSPDAERLAATVQTVLADASYRIRAQRIGDEMAAEPSCAARLDELLAP
jgi:UDP:flavonoid glycosyltransferase YjiC (YdhE family)